MALVFVIFSSFARSPRYCFWIIVQYLFILIGVRVQWNWMKSWSNCIYLFLILCTRIQKVLCLCQLPPVCDFKSQFFTITHLFHSRKCITSSKNSHAQKICFLKWLNPNQRQKWAEVGINKYVILRFWYLYQFGWNT